MDITYSASRKPMHTMKPHAGINEVDHEAIAQIEGVDIKSLQREIEAAERHHQRIAQGLVHLPDGRVQVTEEMDLLHGIAHMEKTTRRMTSSNGPAIKRVNAPLAEDRLRYVLTPLGEAIWMMCRTMVPLIEQLYPGSRRPARLARNQNTSVGVRPTFNPHITVALHACQIALPILSLCSKVSPDLSQKSTRDAMEHLLHSVRRICRSRRFKYRANNYERNARERFRDACKYIAGLLSENSRLLFSRVDIYFLPDHKEWADSAAAEQCIRRFLRALSESRIVPDVKGWVARFENGFRRGIHLHVLVVMDGHKHREAASWSEVLGKTWVSKYSQGRGSYFNCHARKDWYKFNGLGLVHVRDKAKLIGVREALRYMTKPEFHIATGYARNFRRGLMPHSKATKKRGAPRKAEHGMSLVDQILCDPQAGVAG